MVEPNEKIRIENGGFASELRSFTCEGSRAVIVVVPAMGVAAKFYDRFGESLASRNFSVFVSELRGIGSSSVRASRAVDFGYRELLDDLACAVREARARSGALPVFVIGHSLGGHLAVLFGGLTRENIAGAGVVAAGTPYFRNWEMPMRAKLYFGSKIMRGFGTTLGYVPGDRLGFGGREARTLIREWAHFVGTNEIVVSGIDAADMKRKMAEATLPLLGVSLEGDDFAPRVSTDRLVAKAPNAKLTRTHLDGHLFPEKIDHFRWAKSPGPVADEIRAWIDSLLTAR
ncbi:MAG: alpha/beta hydrolase family protein [Polyangiaceae bacterium]